MPAEPLLPGLLALGLIAGGGAMALHAVSWRRRALAGRVGLVSERAARDEADAEGEEAFLRVPAGDLPEDDRRALVRILQRFGVPRRYAPAAFTGFHLALALVLAGVLLATPWRLEGRAAAMAYLGAALAGAVGWFGPLVLLRRLVKGRVARIAAGMPEALELLVVCVEAGLALDDGLERVILEIRSSQPELADELAHTAADMRILPDRDQALAKLAERADSPDIRSVVGTLTQTLRYGTPLARALRTTAAEMRNNALLAMEERANRLPTLLTLPMMLLIMPTVFLMVGGPAALRLIDTFLH